MSDEEDYGFEYSDEEQDEQDVDIENQYYNSKGLLEGEELAEAAAGFEAVLAMEPAPGEWGFKALKQLAKARHAAGDAPGAVAAYRRLLEYSRAPAVTRNAAEKKVNSLLDHFAAAAGAGAGEPGAAGGGAGGGGAPPPEAAALLEQLYTLTLEAARGEGAAANERLWFKTSMKLAHLHAGAGAHDKARAVLAALHASCQDAAAGGDDARKGTQLLEVYALEIQVASRLGDAAGVARAVAAALGVRSAIPHPRVMGVVREAGGRLHMDARAYADAATDFFEAFKSYDEAGSPRRVQCLKYLVLATMLVESAVDPFDSQEARPHRADPEVAAMTALVAAHQAADARGFERVLARHARGALADDLIQRHVGELRRSVRSRVLLAAAAPYSRARLDALAARAGVPRAEAEALLVGLVLDGRLRARIDQVAGVLEMAPPPGPADARADAVARWARALRGVHAALQARLA